MLSHEKRGKIFYITKKEEIDKIVVMIKNYSFKELKKSWHYEKSLLVKNTDEHLLQEIYPLFHRIKLIGLRKKINNNENYDFYYELDDGTAFVFAIDIRKNPPILINAFHFFRNLIKFVENINQQ